MWSGTRALQPTAAILLLTGHAALEDAPPRDQFWGARTFNMRGLNGFRLMFAQQIEALTLDDNCQRDLFPVVYADERNPSVFIIAIPNSC